MKTVAAVLASLSVLLLFPGGPALAHEEAVLKSPTSSVAAGATLPLSGAEFGEDERYTLRLVGALHEYELGGVTADKDGSFVLDLTVPADVSPGEYRIVAIAADGDAAARLDLTVRGPAAADGNVMDMGARAENISITRSRSGLEWGIIGLLVGAAAGFGLSLLSVRRVAV